MTHHATARLAWSLWGLSVALTALFVALVFVSRTSPGPLEYDTTPLLTALWVGLALLFPTLGALIASRQPANAIGWLFCFTGVVLATGLCNHLYADYALFNRPGSVPGGELAAWAASWLLPVGLFVTPIFLLYLFPSGRPASTRWRIVFRVAVAVAVLAFTGMMLKPGSVDTFEVQNPVALRGAAGDAMELLEQAGSVAIIPLLLTGVAALVTRTRGSRGQERQQLKWFAFASSLMGVSFAAAFISSGVGLPAAADVFFIAGAIGLVLIPIASGLAILKYRLYDIDRIINRTLVYGTLTAVLGLGYAGLVVLLQGVLEPITRDQSYAVVGSTLAVAALFRPARARLQSFIDRRFYRAHYDATRTLEEFSARLRDEIDLDALSSELLEVVRSTMQPVHLSLWTRSPEGR